MQKVEWMSLEVVAGDSSHLHQNTERRCDQRISRFCVIRLLEQRLRLVFWKLSNTWKYGWVLWIRILWKNLWVIFIHTTIVLVQSCMWRIKVLNFDRGHARLDCLGRPPCWGLHSSLSWGAPAPAPEWPVLAVCALCVAAAPSLEGLCVVGPRGGGVTWLLSLLGMCWARCGVEVAPYPYYHTQVTGRVRCVHASGC